MRDARDGKGEGSGRTMNCKFLNHSVYLSVVAFCRNRNASVCATASAPPLPSVRCGVLVRRLALTAEKLAMLEMAGKHQGMLHPTRARLGRKRGCPPHHPLFAASHTCIMLGRYDRGQESKDAKDVR